MAHEATVILGLKDMVSPGLQSAQGNVKLFSAGVTAAVVGGAAAFGAFAVSAIGAASDVSESLNKVSVVFGESAQVITDMAATSATAMGMTKNEALGAAGTLGNLLVAMGMTQGPSAVMSANLVRLASDLGSFNNANPADVLEAMRAGLVGEAEPMKRYGVALTENMMKQAAMKAGLGDNIKALSEGQKMALRYNIMLEQTATAHGDFARTSDGLANSMRIIKSVIENAKVAFGEELRPAAEKLAALFQGALPVAVNMAMAAFRGVKGIVLDAATAAAPFVQALVPVVTGVKNLAVGLLALIAQDPKPWIASLAAVLLALMAPAFLAAAGAAISFLLSIAPLLLAAAAVGIVVFALATNFMGLRDILMTGVNTALAFFQQNMWVVWTVLGLVGLTITTQLIPALFGFAGHMIMAGVHVLAFAGHLLFGGVIAIGSFAASLLTTGVSAVIGFASTLLTQGVGAALTYASTTVGAMIPAAHLTAQAFFTKTIPAAIAAAQTFLTQTIPAVAATAAAFLTQTLPAVLTTANAFLANLIPSAAAAAATFLTTTVPAIAATTVSFLTGLIPALITTAVTFFTVTIPAAAANAVAFLAMAVSALVSFAMMVAGAIMTGIGVVIAFLPIILVAAAIGVAIYLLYTNWSSIWAWIVKVTGGAAQKITSWLGKALSWIASNVKKGLNFVYTLFKRVFNAVVGGASQFGASIYNTVTRAIGGMADKVSDIIARLAEWIGKAFTKIVEFARSAITKLPAGNQIMQLLGGIGEGISNTLKGLKETFSGAGGENAASFLDGFQDVMSGEMGMDEFVMDALGLEGMGDLATGAGAGAGGAGGAGGGTSDPLGMWEGTDSSGHWVIDPATGKKVYDAGSVGATRQQANASNAAQTAASRQATSALGRSAGTASGSDSTLDLAKAFTEAIAEAIQVMDDLVAASIPPPEQYQPQLDKIKEFFLQAGYMFRDLASNARDSTFVRYEGALNKNDLKRISSWADPFVSALDTLLKTVEVIAALSDEKLVFPELTVFDYLKDFMIRSGQTILQVSAQIDQTAMTATAPMLDVFGKWLDLLTRAAGAAKSVTETSIEGDIAGSVDRVAEFLTAVSVATGRMVAGAQRLGDDLIEALYVSQDLAQTFGPWMDTLGKVGAASESMKQVDIEPAQLDYVLGEKGVLMQVALMTGTFVTGFAKAYSPAAREASVKISQDLAGTFSAWFDALTKLGPAMTSLADAKPIPEGALTKLQELLSNIAWITHSLMVTDTFDLTANAQKTVADLAVARDLFGTLTTAMDALAKAAGMDLSKAARVTEEQLLIAAQNARDALRTLINLAGAWGSMAAEMRDDVFARVKEYAAVVAPVVDALAKAANLGLDKSVRVTETSLAVAENNARDAVATVARLASLWAILPKAMREDLFAQIKAYADIVGPCVDMISDAANLGLDEAMRATEAGLAVAEANAVSAVAVVQRLVATWADMEAAVREQLFTLISDYAEAAGDAAELIRNVANLGLDEAVLVTEEGMIIAEANAAAAMFVLQRLTGWWMLMADEARTRMFSAMQAYAEVASAAVEMVSDAASLGSDLAAATDILPDRIAVVERNTAIALGIVERLAAGWSHLEGEVRTKLFDEITAYAETVGKAVEAVSSAASLGAEMAETTLVPEKTWRIVEDNMIASVFALIGVIRTVGAAAMAEARSAAEAAGPALDTIGKALEIFTLEKIMESPFVAKYRGFKGKDSSGNAVAKDLANRLQAGIVLMFQTLQNALLSIGPVPTEIAAYATALFAAYSPLLDLVERINGLTIDLDKVAQIAKVPGLLADGMGAGGAGGGAGEPGGGGLLGSLLGNGPITLTGPVTAVGPVYHQGTQNIEVTLDGETIQRTTRSGYTQSARNREARGAKP